MGIGACRVVNVTPTLAQVLEKGWFSSGDTAVKVAVAYALSNGLQPTTSGPFETVWNVGTLDRADFRAIVSLISGQSEIWGLVQGLGDAGLRELAQKALASDVPTELMLADGY